MTTQPPTDDAPFTTGEFKAVHGTIEIKKPNGRWYALFFNHTATKKDALLCTAAFNAATSLHRSGYDAQKVFEALPEIMNLFGWTHGIEGNHVVFKLKERLRRKPKP